jgi:dipeptidyl aminopeptidase/acylaminoacyl peptidase
MFATAVVDVAYDGAPRERAVEAWEKVRGKPWAFDLPPESHHYWSFSRRIASYLPEKYWPRVEAPALLLYGADDQRVPVQSSMDAIVKAYRSGKGKGIELMIFLGADHTFRLRPAPGGAFSWPSTAEGYPDRMLDWASSVTTAIHRPCR